MATGLSVDGAMVDGSCSGRGTLQSLEGPGCTILNSGYFGNMFPNSLLTTSTRLSLL